MNILLSLNCDWIVENGVKLGTGAGLLNNLLFFLRVAIENAWNNYILAEYHVVSRSLNIKIVHDAKYGIKKQFYMRLSYYGLIVIFSIHVRNTIGLKKTCILQPESDYTTLEKLLKFSIYHANTHTYKHKYTHTLSASLTPVMNLPNN